MADNKKPEPTPQPKPYTITSTRDQMVMGSDGRLYKAKVIYWQTPMGDAGHVEIPAAQFSAQAAENAILDEIEQLLKLRGMI